MSTLRHIIIILHASALTILSLTLTKLFDFLFWPSRDMMAIPDLQWFIFSYLQEGTTRTSSNEAKLNLMQTFFLVLDLQTSRAPENVWRIFDKRFITVNSVSCFSCA